MNANKRPLLGEERTGLSAKTLVLHFATSALFLLLGYAGGYGMLACWLTQGDEWAIEIVTNSMLQLACCLPVVLPLCTISGSLGALVEGRFKTSPLFALALNGLASLLAGFILYIPFELLLMLGAAL